MEEEVNVGYGKVKKKELVTPVTKLDGEKQKFVYKDIYDMLRTMPGVQVSGKSIKIQGAESFMSSTEPLLVVDGMTVTTIDDIMPESVKSIDILKGSSASIYGSRGANGVILITLKGAR
jgi:TonB-dependent SusC/RagA subfamily outer membrane receptor